MTSSLYFLPPMSSPPWALISSKISSVAFLCGIPHGAAGPERGVETPNLMTSCARQFPGPRATSPAAARNAVQITERCDLIATPPRLVLGQRTSRTRTIGTPIAACQWGTAVKGSRPVGGLDYTHGHVDAWKGDPVPEVPAGAGRRARPGRGAPVRSGRGPGPQRPLRERGDSDPAPVTPGPLRLSVQRRRPGRGGRARPGERGRAEPPLALPPRLGAAYLTAAITASSARTASASAAGSRVLPRSRGV